MQVHSGTDNPAITLGLLVSEDNTTTGKGSWHDLLDGLLYTRFQKVCVPSHTYCDCIFHMLFEIPSYFEIVVREVQPTFALAVHLALDPLKKYDFCLLFTRCCCYH